MMKLKPDISLQAFLQAVKNCRENVWFTTEEGDRLNVRSSLSQYVFILMDGDKQLRNSGRIECSNPKDYETLAPWLLKEV